MVCSLAEFSPPFQNETWIKDGLPTQQLYEFLIKVADNNELINQGIANLARFANLSAIELIIKNPSDGYTVMVNNQGLATFKASLGPIGTWVKSADDTTVII